MDIQVDNDNELRPDSVHVTIISNRVIVVARSPAFLMTRLFGIITPRHMSGLHLYDSWVLVDLYCYRGTETTVPVANLCQKIVRSLFSDVNSERD